MLLAALVENVLDGQSDRVRFQESYALPEQAEAVALAAEDEDQPPPFPVRLLLSRRDPEAAFDLARERSGMDLDAGALRVLHGWMTGDVSLVAR